MKSALLIVGLIAVLPIATWVRRNPQHHAKLWFVMGTLPFILTVGPHPLFIAVVSWAGWPGYVKGIEISAIDILGLAIFLSQRKTLHELPFRFAFGLYIFSILLSALQAGVPTASLFYAWQFTRIFLIYAVVAKACASDARVAPALLTGFATGVWLAVGIAAWQRIYLGAVQAGGSVGDKNLLGLMTHFVGIPWFALLLAGQRGPMPIWGPLGSATAAVLTVSRATLGLAGVGVISMFIISSVRKWTQRKAKVGLLTAVIVASLLPVVVMSLEARFAREPLPDNYDERAVFEKAARSMLADYPLGVGANNYVVVANTGGYNQRAGVAAVQNSLATNVHNTYLLTAAENGYLGIVAFVILLTQPIIVAFRCGWRHRSDATGDLLLGLGISLLIIGIHCFFEWIFVTFPVEYLFGMTVGLVAGLAKKLGYWRRAGASGRTRKILSA